MEPVVLKAVTPCDDQVFGGPSGGDYGDVRDPSPVEGPYDPQTGDILLRLGS